MNESEEYYCFRVKDSELGVDNANIVIPRSYNFDLKKLRLELVSLLNTASLSIVRRNLRCPQWLFFFFLKFQARKALEIGKYIAIGLRVILLLYLHLSVTLYM